LKPGINIQQTALSEEREKAWIALLLGWVAGFADAFGFLVLDRIFTSHISGNSVVIGAEAGQGQWVVAARHAWPILFFIIGFFIGLVLETACARLQLRRRFSAALILELALLVTFFFFGRRWMHSEGIVSVDSAKFYFLVAALAGAMGVQSANLRRVRGQSVHTSYVTGMLTHSVENAVKVLFAFYDRLRNRTPESAEEDVKRMIFYAGLWCSFTGGAVCGGFGESHWSFSCLLAPLGVLMFIIVCDLIRPVQDS
jgi:uncharacterized membrane protein YoaK (UPF0700 family)